MRPAWLRLGVWTWVGLAIATLPLIVAGEIYENRSHDAADILEVVNDQIAATIPDGIQVQSPFTAAASGDRRTVAYVGTMGQRQCLCINSSVNRCAPQIGGIVISGDGSRVAWFEASVKSGGNFGLADPVVTGWHVVADGQAGPDYSEIKNLQLAGGTARVAYIARSAEGWQFVLGDRTGKTYSEISWSTLSENGERSVYLARAENGLVLVVDGVPGPTVDECVAFSFSRDGRHLAYVCRDGDGTFLMHDGQRSPQPAELKDLILNADGSRLCRILQYPGAVRLMEGDKTSQIFKAKTATVNFSVDGRTIGLFLQMQEGGFQIWSGDDPASLRRSRGAELARIFQTDWWGRMGGDAVTPQTCDSDTCVWLEKNGRQLRWRRYRWPPTHITRIDAAGRDPDLRETRDALLSATKDRSAERFLDYVAPDVRANFGDPCCGVAYFRSAYNLDDRSSPFWEEAQRVLESGGLWGRERGEPVFTAPGLPLDTLAPLFGTDGQDVGLVTGEGVNLRAKPSAGSTLLRHFDWEPAASLPFAEGADLAIEKTWVRVRALDGQEGYIERAHLTSIFDSRALFAKRDGRWVLTAFVAGD